MLSARMTLENPDAEGFVQSRNVTLALVAYLVESYPGRTSAELAEMASKDRVTMARRVSEAAGSTRHNVFRGKTRKCSITGHKALTWWSKPTQA